MIGLTACSKAAVLTPIPTPSAIPSTTITVIANTPIATSAPTLTVIPTPTPTLDLSKHYGGWPPQWLAYDPTVQAVATAASERASVYETAIALTPTPMTQPTWSPQPTPTLGLGMISDNGCVYPTHPGKPSFSSCWHTNVAGTWFFVAVGSQGDGIEQQVQGLLWVSAQPYPHNPKGSDQQFYLAPRPDLHITAVDGARITLASRDPAVSDTFFFDLATRQWVTPGPSPVPSALPTP